MSRYNLAARERDAWIPLGEDLQLRHAAQVIAICCPGWPLAAAFRTLNRLGPGEEADFALLEDGGRQRRIRARRENVRRSGAGGPSSR